MNQQQHLSEGYTGVPTPDLVDQVDSGDVTQENAVGNGGGSPGEEYHPVNNDSFNQAVRMEEAESHLLAEKELEDASYQDLEPTGYIPEISAVTEGEVSPDQYSTKPEMTPEEREKIKGYIKEVQTGQAKYTELKKSFPISDFISENGDLYIDAINQAQSDIENGRISSYDYDARVAYYLSRYDPDKFRVVGDYDEALSQIKESTEYTEHLVKVYEYVEVSEDDGIDPQIKKRAADRAALKRARVKALGEAQGKTEEEKKKEPTEKEKKKIQEEEEAKERADTIKKSTEQAGKNVEGMKKIAEKKGGEEIQSKAKYSEDQPSDKIIIESDKTEGETWVQFDSKNEQADTLIFGHNDIQVGFPIRDGIASLADMERLSDGLYQSGLAAALGDPVDIDQLQSIADQTQTIGSPLDLSTGLDPTNDSKNEAFTRLSEYIAVELLTEIAPDLAQESPIDLPKLFLAHDGLEERWRKAFTQKVVGSGGNVNPAFFGGFSPLVAQRSPGAYEKGPPSYQGDEYRSKGPRGTGG